MCTKTHNSSRHTTTRTEEKPRDVPLRTINDPEVLLPLTTTGLQPYLDIVATVQRNTWLSLVSFTYNYLQEFPLVATSSAE